ncbi:MAG: DUF924 domain-containing protein [Gammaproteobacteria bacterium]|nr:DUF924 domain-containing protein [Gammaproteobacteria bacterium]
MIDRIEKILEFWFGTFPNAWTADKSKQDMWFGNGAAYDADIFSTFGADYFRAVDGELDSWAESPRGRLALIILLDQFSRHIHRGGAEAFAQDQKAQQLCIEGISAGDDQSLHPVERSFFYLPLEHAEDLERQNLAIEAYSQLIQDVPEQYRQPLEVALEWAQKHHYVIERFGRFPELNEILGRESTDEEIAFIKEDEYSFL